MSFLSPLFLWTDAMLKNGRVALDSVQALTRRAQSARVGVIPTTDAPPKGATGSKPKARVKAKRKAKGRRR